MKHIVPTLVDAPDELSRAGLIGILSGARYKPISARPECDTIASSGRPAPEMVILMLNGTIKDSAAVVRKIETMAVRSKVVILADHCDPQLVRNAICAGAVAYLPRSVSAAILLQTLDLVVEGELILPASVARGVLSYVKLQPESEYDTPASPQAADHIARLSSREIEILKQLINGDSNKQIGRQLDISETTVKVHVKAILRKIRARNRTQAAIWGIDHLPDLSATSPRLSSPPILAEAVSELVANRAVQPAATTQRNGSRPGCSASVDPLINASPVPAYARTARKVFPQS